MRWMKVNILGQALISPNDEVAARGLDEHRLAYAVKDDISTCDVPLRRKRPGFPSHPS